MVLAPVIIGGKTFRIQDCGAKGACLFKCISKVSLEDHRITRRALVNHVIQNWERNREWVNFVLGVNNKSDYRVLMMAPKTYGSEIEVQAASELYSVNITLLRRMSDGTEFSVNFWCEQDGASDFYLLFTGMENARDWDGHYQILQEIDDQDSSNHEGNVPLITGSPQQQNRCDQHSIDAVGDVPLIIESQQLQNGCDVINVPRVLSNSKDKSNPSVLASPSDPKKRRVMSKKDKERIISLRMTLAQGNGARLRIVDMTAEAFEISKSTVMRISREFRNNAGELQEPRNYLAGRKKIAVTAHHEGVLRKLFFDTYARKEFPSGESLMCGLREEVPDFPDMSVRTLLRVMNRMGFKFVRGLIHDLYNGPSLEGQLPDAPSKCSPQSPIEE
ncbi:hypothetical protein QAD02_021355 [Eretmocerus hayati]|uniref:Uncharacterized protein n=1 Tax=Eretmocerus hayati TaxID=131215 RepID=A0ACC2PQ89_9HYME|nr:hypothetical protein QAD02_021355 [Eretmocerus hayati]